MLEAEGLLARVWEVVAGVAGASAVWAGQPGIWCVDWAGCGCDSAMAHMVMLSEPSSALACLPHAGHRV